MRKLRQLKLDNCSLLFLPEYGKWMAMETVKKINF